MFEAKSKTLLLIILLVLCGLCSGCITSDKFMVGTQNDTNMSSKNGPERGAELGDSNEYENDFETSNKNVLINLIKDLESSSHETRLNAAAELGEIGKPAADALIEKLDTETSNMEEINSYMLLALLETGDERTLETLSLSLKKKGEISGKNEAVESENREISEDMLNAVDAKDKALRKHLADSLDGEYGTETDALVQALNAEEQNADIYVTIALPEYSGEETGDKNETEKLVQALKSGNGCTRISAVMALGEKGEKDSVEPILQILARDYPLVRISAALSLGMIGDEGAVDTLLKELKGNEDKYIRRGNAIALGKIGEERAVTYLVQRLEDKDAGVRSSAALALGMIGDERALEPLIEVLESGNTGDGRVKSVLNTNAEVRKSAVLALGELGSREATGTLISVLKNDGEALEVRKAAAASLGEIGDPEAVDALIEKMDDKELGEASRKALACMGEMAVEPLIETLETGDRKRKTEAALLLIEIGDEKAIEPLIGALR